MYRPRKLNNLLEKLSLDVSDIQILENKIKEKEEWKAIEKVDEYHYYFFKLNQQGNIDFIEYPCYLFYSINFEFFIVTTSKNYTPGKHVLFTFDTTTYGHSCKIGAPLIKN